MKDKKDWSYDDPGMSLTYLTSILNLLPNALKLGKLSKSYFLKTVKAKAIKHALDKIWITIHIEVRVYVSPKC